MELVHLIITIALAEFVFFCFMVGRARGIYKVPAPATTGNEIFERYFRVQMNTLEQLITFVPAILLFAAYVHAPTAAALGLIFVIGRAVYFSQYVQNPGKRGAGFGLSFLPNAVLLLGAIVGIVMHLIRDAML